MSEWVRRWKVSYMWRAGLEGPLVYSRGVDTPAELRAALDEARRNPDILKTTYESIRELVGEPPALCPRGHATDGGSTTRARMAWYDCDTCPGHLVYRCALCGEVMLDPPAAQECRPRRVEPRA